MQYPNEDLEAIAREGEAAQEEENQPQSVEGWESLFDKEFHDLTHVSCGGHTVPCGTMKYDVKNFIRQLLTHQQSKILKPIKKTLKEIIKQNKRGMAVDLELRELLFSLSNNNS